MGTGSTGEVQIEFGTVGGLAERILIELIAFIADLADGGGGIGLTDILAVVGVADVIGEGGASFASPALSAGEIVPDAIDGDAVSLGGIEGEARDAGDAYSSSEGLGGVEANAVGAFTLLRLRVEGEFREALIAPAGLDINGETVGVGEVIDAETIGIEDVAIYALFADEEGIVILNAVIFGGIAEAID